MISKGFYFSSKIEKNKGDRDFNAKWRAGRDHTVRDKGTWIA